MIARMKSFLHRMRSHISRSEWIMRHFKLAISGSPSYDPGLVLIQIDGLSHTEMQKAMDAGRLPFLQSLLQKEQYQVSEMYSGLPSSTPAVQAELFYGVKHAIPAFCYYDSACERIFSMFEGDDVREMEKRLQAQGDPLLEKGSSYSNIYTGGAAEAHFCMAKYGWPDILRKASPPILALIMLLHVYSLARVVVLFFLELGLAIIDFFRGVIAKKNLWAELKFIPSRLAVCIIMRELIVMRTSIDLQRGLPIVHMTFLGYDEQSHRRGPDSRFAHWTLKGIDYAIKRIFKASRRSMRRDYDLWVYSDHGQSKVISYQSQTGENVQSSISRIFDQTFSSGDTPPEGIQIQRAKMLRTPRHRPETQPPDRFPIATGLGPLGCIYLGSKVPKEKRHQMAERLVHKASIPLVLAKSSKDQAVAWTAKGCYTLPQDAAQVLGKTHPFPADTAADLVALCHHKDAGDFLIAGFALGKPCMSFPSENGAHGGPAPDETKAFAIIPGDIPLYTDGKTLRVSHIRNAAQTLLRRREPRPPQKLPSNQSIDTLRILSYNIHSCIGMDGIVSPHRIARVIEREKPDVIALQEVDVERLRSGMENQAHEIARYLGMHVHFFPALQIEEEQYGDAILSRFPMKILRAGALPYRKHILVNEPRGALWVEIDLGGDHRLQMLNTHFGLGHQERREQADALLGPDWLGHADCQGPVILCGDFNTSPRSDVYQSIGKHLQDVQVALVGQKRLKTFPGTHPFGYIDHIWVNKSVTPLNVRVPCHYLARVASDHLPLVADVNLTKTNNLGMIAS